MDRTACIDLPAFPLQLLLLRRPEWNACPAAVVDADRPQGKILWVNERARQRRILPGMRYAAGLSLAGDLRAAEVPATEIERATTRLGRALQNFSPRVEPSREDPGVFWLDASGLTPLHESLRAWAGLVRADLERRGFRSSLTVGYSRFGTYALSRTRRGVLVLDRAADEHAAARRVPIERLSIEPACRDTLLKLGVRTVGQFLDLPVDGIEKRFGPGLKRLHRMASGELRLPLRPEHARPPVVHSQPLDHPETSVPRLLAIIGRLTGPLLKELVERGRALTRVHVGFCFERLGDHVERIRTAAPTLDAEQVLGLIRLRLEALRKLPDGVMEVKLAAESTPATSEQLQMFRQRSRRDLAAADRALARIRAELGDGAVVRARLREGHLPEAGYHWEPLDRVVESRPREVGDDRLVRRIFVRPITLAERPRHEPDGWMPRDLQHGPVVKLQGPYVVSGGWWRRSVHREYHFAETQRGELLWVFYDRLRRRWFLHGRVE